MDEKTNQIIGIRFNKKSKAKLFGIIKSSKYIFGEPMGIDVIITNHSEIPFPSENCKFHFSIEWPIRQTVLFDTVEIQKNSIKAGESITIDSQEDTNCMSEGYALISLKKIHFEKNVSQQFKIKMINGSQEPLFWQMNNNDAINDIYTNNAIDSFYVVRKQEIYASWALFTTIIALLVNTFVAFIQLL